jgi:hypothetical protein
MVARHLDNKVRRRQYMFAMRQGLVSLAASVPRVACLAAASRGAACPLAGGAPIVLRAAACGNAVQGCPSVGGQRSVVQAPGQTRAPCGPARGQRQRPRGSAQARRGCINPAPVLLAPVFFGRAVARSAVARAPALRVRSACGAIVLRCGRHRPAAHAGGGVSGVGASAAEQGAVLSHQQRAGAIVQGAPPNPSIERTSKRLRLFAAAHVER